MLTLLGTSSFLAPSVEDSSLSSSTSFVAVSEAASFGTSSVWVSSSVGCSTSSFFSSSLTEVSVEVSVVVAVTSFFSAVTKKYRNKYHLFSSYLIFELN